MKSTTSPTPSGLRKRVNSTLLSGRYICLCWASKRLAILKKPPLRSSRMAAKMLGESNCGRQHQSIEPSMLTSATVCRAPMTPQDPIGLYALSPLKKRGCNYSIRLVGAGEHGRWHVEAERLRCLEIDHQLVLGRRLHRHVGWLLALEDTIHIAGSAHDNQIAMNLRQRAPCHDYAAIRG